MTKRITDTTNTYVDDRTRPFRVEMSSVEGSPVCTIRFGRSFTLNSVTPYDLMDLAHDLEAFAHQALQFHYGEKDRNLGKRPVGEVMAELQQKLEACGIAEPVGVEWEINEARAKYLREEEELAESDDFYSALIDENMKKDESQQHIAGDGFDAFYAAHADAARADASKTPTPDQQSKVERLMQGTVSAPQTDPMNDPMNW